jgi:hypothetical protein
MDYSTLQLVKNYLLLDIDSSFDSQIEAWIGGASRMMDNMCNRKLVASDTPTAQYFDGNNTTQLMVDDFVAITELAKSNTEYSDGTFSVVTSTDYITYPKISTEMPRARGLILKNDVFNWGYQNWRVTARWGYLAQITEDLQFACTVIVAGIVTAQTNGQQSKTSEKIGNYAVTYSDQKGWADYNNALKTLETYKKHMF